MTESSADSLAWLRPYAGAFDIIECATESEWLAERDNGIGASDVAIVLGISEWGSPFHLWAQKSKRMEQGMSDAEHLEWGRFAEDGIASRYAYRTGRTLRDLGRFTILRSKAHPFLFCTLDRIIMSLPDDERLGFANQDFMRGPAPCEIKQATIYGFRAWDDGVPLKVQSQLQTQLLVTGWEWGSIAATMPNGKFDAVDCERNPDFIQLVIEKCAAFWECVKSGDWPPPDGSDWTAKALKAIYPRDSGAEITLPAEAAEWDAELQQAKAQRKLAEAHEEEMKNRFAAALGDATFGVLPDGSRYSYKTKITKEHMRRESISRTLLRLKS